MIYYLLLDYHEEVIYLISGLQINFFKIRNNYFKLSFPSKDFNLKNVLDINHSLNEDDKVQKDFIAYF